MNIWKVLEIEKTKDKDAIKKAYREKLSTVNPEDDAEGFMELRQAFDEANRYADDAEAADAGAEQGENTPADNLMSDLKKLYADFYRRISAEAWTELFNTDYCVSLDTSEEARDVVLRFVSEYYHLPSRVFKVLVGQYAIDERKEELYEIFPSQFIDFIINNAKYADSINYDLFDGDADADYDEYISDYYALESAVRNREIEKQDKLIEKLSKSGIYNPYITLMKIRNLQQKEDREAAKKLAEELVEKYPDELKFIICMGDVYSELSETDKAEEYYEKAYEANKDDITAHYKIAEISLAKKDFEKARDTFVELMKINHYDNAIISGLIQANDGLIEEYKEKLEENPDDNKTRMEMAWSYYQSYKFKDGIDILDTFEPDSDNVCEYYNVKGRTYLCLDRIGEALKCFKIWKEEIEKLPQDTDDEEITKKTKRYPYVNFLIGDCYLKRERYEEAREYIEYALSREHEEIILSYEAKCELEYGTENYEKCIDACEELLKKDENSYTAYDYMAKSFYRLGMYREAMDMCEKAIRIYPYIINPYELQVKMFINVKSYDNAQAVINRYTDMGIDSDFMKMLNAKILVDRDGNYEKAAEMLQKISDNNDKGESDLPKREYDRFFMLWASCYEERDNTDEAMRIYQKLIRVYPETKAGHGLLGLIYKNKMMLEEAVEELTLQLEIEEDDYYFLHRGIIYKYKEMYAEAKSDFLNALRLNPGNGYLFRILGVTCNALGEYEESLSYLDKALPVISENYVKDVMHQKALTLECMVRFEDAEKVYIECLEKFDGDTETVVRYSRLLQRMKRIVAAADVLEKAKIEDEADKRSIYYRVLRQALDTGNLTHAVQILERAEKNNIANSCFYVVIAEMYMERHKYAKAESYYLKAVEADKKGYENYYSELAEAASRQFASGGRVQRYIKQCLNKIKNPETNNNPEDLIALARVERVRKNYDKAMAYLNRATGGIRCAGCFYGKCVDAYIEMGKVLEAMGKDDEAILAYSQAMKFVGYDRESDLAIKRLKAKKN